MISWGNHEIITHHPRAVGKVPYKYALQRRKFKCNYSAMSMISHLGLVGVDVRQLVKASAFVRVARRMKRAPAHAQRATAVQDSTVPRGPW